MVYRKSDPLHWCPRCGRQVHVSETARDWTGPRVCIECADEKPMQYSAGYGRVRERGPWRDVLREPEPVTATVTGAVTDVWQWTTADNVEWTDGEYVAY